MLNLKTLYQKIKTNKAISVHKSEQEIIAEIHNEFDMAEDKLLKQANDLLKSLKITPESEIEAVADRLGKIGFSNTPTVKKAISLKEQREIEKSKIVKTKEVAELINYYKQNYPFQKYITQEELDRICDKYVLTYAPIRNYIQDVPEKNLKEIEQAKELINGDAIAYSVYISVVKFRDNCPKEVRDLLKKKLLVEHSEYFSTSESNINHFLTSFLNSMGYNKSIDSWGWFDKFEVELANKSSLFIAAPASHFNLEGLKKEGKHGYLSTTKSIIKNDPIVFRYVRGGIQVITKWGLEASDPMLLNEINN